MSGGEWWNDSNNGVGDYSPDQTAQTNLGQDQQNRGVDQNTTYTPPGQLAPADQWNFTPDPNAPGGYQAHAPGTVAPLDQPQFSNQTGQYPNDQSMTHAVANNAAGQYAPTVDASGNATMGGNQGVSGYQAYQQQITQSSPQAGIANVPLGQGWIQGVNSPGQMVNILPQNLANLYNPQLAPGYLPGSGTYNQYDLSKGTLFGKIAGVMSNLNYGVGGPGDPTHGAAAGLEQQTPDQWVQGDDLFQSTVGNIGTGQGNGTDGLDYIATLFARGDTPSGINTVAFGAPDQYWQGLYQAIARGIIKPTTRGWQLLATRGVTPQAIGGQAPAYAQSVGVGANGAAVTQATGTPVQGGVTPGTVAMGPGNTVNTASGPMGPNTEAINVNAGQLALNTKRLQDLEIPQMQNTAANQYLQVLAGLRGPADLFQYLKVLGGTPQGIKDVVNASAGAYAMPRTGATGTGGTSGPADLQSVLAQMNDPNYGQQGQGLNLPAPNQLNGQALLRMTPAQIQVLLSAYESQGWRPEDVLAIFKNSLPQYGGSQQAGHVALFG